MQFTILRQNLKTVLDNAKSTVRPVNQVECSRFVKFDINPNETTLTAYDLNTGYVSVIDASTLDSGEFLVELDKLNALTAKMNGESVECNVDMQSSTMTIKCGRSKVRLAVMPADNYPSIPDYSSSDRFTVNGQKLAEMIRQTVFAVAVTDNKPILTGELFTIENNTLSLAAIDGYRLAVRKETVSTADKYSFVVKGDTLKSVSKLAKDNDVTLIPSKRHIVFDFGRCKVFARLLEGDFINYNKSIPESSNAEAVINTRNLIECLERFALMVDSKAKSALKCTFGNGTLEMQLKSASGEMADYIDIDFAGQITTIGFNVYFLLDALKASESDKVKFQLNGGLSPMKILPVDGDDYIFLVLPVRLKD